MKKVITALLTKWHAYVKKIKRIENSDVVYKEVEGDKLDPKQKEEIMEFLELITQDGFIPPSNFLTDSETKILALKKEDGHKETEKMSSER